jgi:conjugative relaxase-like TrwC/TraI family protein
MHRLTTQRADYYLTDLATELPVPTSRQHWEGQAAARLGLEGAVDPERFGAVLEGRHPHTGRPLRSDRATVQGYDLTFSAPKSVSVLFALGEPDVAEQVVAAHGEGVRGAVAYLERHGLTARRGSGEDRHAVGTTGAVAASFVHGVNRNQDPHLHTHVVVANLVHGEDGRWSACDQRGLTAHREAAAAMYDSHTRAELTRRLGLRWSEHGMRHSELEGVSPLLLGEFSSRAADIRRHMAERDVRSAAGARVAWAATRADKGPGASFEDLRGEWQRRARAIDGDGPDLERRGGVERQTINEHRFRASLSGAPDGAARRRDVITAFAVSARDGAPADTVEHLTDDWVPSGPGGVAEPAHQLRDLIPPGYLLQTLGPRPVDEESHGVWRQAARHIDAYRQTWQVRDRVEALGVDERGGLAALPTPRLIHHLQTRRQIDTARQRLGWQPPRLLERDRGR